MLLVVWLSWCFWILVVCARLICLGINTFWIWFDLGVMFVVGLFIAVLLPISFGCLFVLLLWWLLDLLLFV